MHPLAPPLAFGFGNLAMLGWLAAAAAPLIIHLWNRRNFRHTDWAAMQFLLAALRQNARRLQLRQWLLLAVRTAIIVLVVTAVAEPFWQRAGLSVVAGQRVHKILVIDGSYSMAYRPADRDRFTRAQQLAAQIVDESRQGDAFSLVLLAAPPRLVVGAPAYEPAEMRKEIAALRMPHGGADLPATVAVLEEVVARAERETTRLDRTEIYFLSDLGRNTWLPDLGGTSAAEAFTRRLEGLAAKAELVVIDVGQTGCENLAVTSFRQLDPYATTKQPVTFQAVLRNYGRQPQSRHAVRLVVDGTPQRETPVDVAPGGEQSVSFTHRFEVPGRHVVEVRSAEDLLALDDRRFLAVSVKSQLNVLVVGGATGASRYLATALVPKRSDESAIAVREAAETAILEADLSEIDAIFLSNVAQFTADEARVLASYLAQGGGLVFFLGDAVQPERYNQQLLAGAPGAASVLPAKLGPLVEEAQYRFQPLEYKHPLVAPFRGQEDAGLLSTPVYRYFRLQPLAGLAGVKVALAFEGGDPAIVEAPIDRGRSILVATAGTLASVDPVTRTPWTTMPAWPSFVPIVQELLSLAVGSQVDRHQARVGEPLGEPLAPSRLGRPLVIRTPEGSTQPVRIDAESHPPRWSFDAATESGIYYLQETSATTKEATAANAATAANTAEGEPIAVNMECLESDLAKADAAELPGMFYVQTDWQSLDRTATTTITRRNSLSRWLLGGALALVFLETWLAWRFGRGV